MALPMQRAGAMPGTLGRAPFGGTNGVILQPHLGVPIDLSWGQVLFWDYPLSIAEIFSPLI